MKVDKKTVKALFTADEFQLFELSQPKQISSLSIKELNDLMRRSRIVRDKWVDVARKQQRSSQSAQSGRQTADNARSQKKAELFAGIHQSFSDRHALASQGKVQVPPDQGPDSERRKESKAASRAERADARGELRKTSRKLNRASKAVESGSSSMISDQNTQSSKAKSAPTPSTRVENAKRQTGQKKTTSSKTKKAVSAKLAKMNKSRKSALKKKASVDSGKASSQGSQKADTIRGDDARPISKSEVASRNRPIQSIATKKRVARGGGSRIRGHVSASGKRAQGRRDSKG